MFRDQLMNKQMSDQSATGFRWRGTDVTRLEGFTDAVLGFAITLLVVSLDVPDTFDELLRATYVYPLKFLAGYLLDDLIGLGAPDAGDSSLMPPQVEPDQLHVLMIVYGLGFVAVRGMFLILYFYAWRQRGPLQLSALEQFDTRTSILANAINVAVGCLSIAISIFGGPDAAMWAGWTYLLLFPLLSGSSILTGRRRRRLFPAAAPV